MLLDSTSLAEYFASSTIEPGEVRAALGPRIRRARVQRLHGLNLEVFGRQIGELMGRRRAFSNVTISNWETGRQEPSFEALVAIARLTHLPLRYFAGVGDMEDYPFIDWLVAEREVDLAPLDRVLANSRKLPASAQKLIDSQLRSLIDDLYRLQPRE